MEAKSKAFKGLVFVVVVAIVVVGILLLVKTYGGSSLTQAEPGTSDGVHVVGDVPEGVDLNDLEGSDAEVFIIDESGNIIEGGSAHEDE